jgi:signal peptidase II
MADPAPAPADLRRIRSNRAIGLTVAAFIFFVDQAVKWVLTGPFQMGPGPDDRHQIELLPFFDLTFVPNYGVSMGFLHASNETTRWLLVGLTAAIALFVAAWMWRERRLDDSIGLSLVLGGALGNILDRVRFGYVVDYADLHFGEIRPFLVFNVADAAITIGVLLLLVRALLSGEGKRKKKEVS